MSAPMRVSGSMIRFMGRFCMEASPVSTAEKSLGARMPDMSRMVVPLFPQSKMPSGAVRP